MDINTNAPWSNQAPDVTSPVWKNTGTTTPPSTWANASPTTPGVPTWMDTSRPVVIAPVVPAWMDTVKPPIVAPPTTQIGVTNPFLDPFMRNIGIQAPTVIQQPAYQHGRLQAPPLGIVYPTWADARVSAPTVQAPVQMGIGSGIGNLVSSIYDRAKNVFGGAPIARPVAQPVVDYSKFPTMEQVSGIKSPSLVGTGRQISPDEMSNIFGKSSATAPVIFSSEAVKQRAIEIANKAEAGYNLWSVPTPQEVSRSKAVESIFGNVQRGGLPATVFNPFAGKAPSPTRAPEDYVWKESVGANVPLSYKIDEGVRKVMGGILDYKALSTGLERLVLPSERSKEAYTTAQTEFMLSAGRAHEGTFIDKTKMIAGSPVLQTAAMMTGAGGAVGVAGGVLRAVGVGSKVIKGGEIGAGLVMGGLFAEEEGTKAGKGKWGEVMADVALAGISLPFYGVGKSAVSEIGGKMAGAGVKMPEMFRPSASTKVPDFSLKSPAEQARIMRAETITSVRGGEAPSAFTKAFAPKAKASMPYETTPEALKGETIESIRGRSLSPFAPSEPRAPMPWETAPRTIRAETIKEIRSERPMFGIKAPSVRKAPMPWETTPEAVRSETVRSIQGVKIPSPFREGQPRIPDYSYMTPEGQARYLKSELKFQRKPVQFTAGLSMEPLMKAVKGAPKSELEMELATMQRVRGAPTVGEVAPPDWMAGFKKPKGGKGFQIPFIGAIPPQTRQRRKTPLPTGEYVPEEVSVTYKKPIGGLIDFGEGAGARIGSGTIGQRRSEFNIPFIGTITSPITRPITQPEVGVRPHPPITRPIQIVSPITGTITTPIQDIRQDQRQGQDQRQDQVMWADAGQKQVHWMDAPPRPKPEVMPPFRPFEPYKPPKPTKILPPYSGGTSGGGAGGRRGGFFRTTKEHPIEYDILGRQVQPGKAPKASRGKSLGQRVLDEAFGIVSKKGRRK